MKKILSNIDDLIFSIKENEEYIDYMEAKSKVKKDVNYYNQISNFKKNQFEINMRKNNENIGLEKEFEALKDEYSRLMMNPFISDFFIKEKRYIKIVSNIYETIGKEINIDLDFLDE